MASDQNPFEALLLVRESAFGTVMTSPVAGTDSIVVRLSGPNRWTPRPIPTRRKIGLGDGFAAPGYQVSDQTAVTGDLQVEFCYSQADFLLGWSSARINGGQTSPWTTTEAPGDLASVSAYHAIMRDDGTVKRRLYQGCKVASWSLPSSSETGTSLFKASIVAQRAAAVDPTSGAFPMPAATAYPADPVLFYQLGGALLVGGSAVLYPTAFNVDVTNNLDTRFFASRYATFSKLRGRECKAELDALYTASPSWRDEMEALTTQALAVTWTGPGPHTVALDFKGNNIIEGVTDDLTPGRTYQQKIMFNTQYDTSVPGDFSYSVT